LESTNRQKKLGQEDTNARIPSVHLFAPDFLPEFVLEDKNIAGLVHRKSIRRVKTNTAGATIF